MSGSSEANSDSSQGIIAWSALCSLVREVSALQHLADWTFGMQIWSQGVFCHLWLLLAQLYLNFRKVEVFQRMWNVLLFLEICMCESNQKQVTIWVVHNFPWCLLEFAESSSSLLKLNTKVTAVITFTEHTHLFILKVTLTSNWHLDCIYFLYWKIHGLFCSKGSGCIKTD